MPHLPPPRRRRRWGAQRKTRDRLAFDVVAGALRRRPGLGVDGLDRGRLPRAAAAATARRRQLAAPVSRAVSASLTDPRAKSTAYLEDAAARRVPGPAARAQRQAAGGVPHPGRGSGRGGGRPALRRRGGRQRPRGDRGRTWPPSQPGIYKLAVELDKARRPVVRPAAGHAGALRGEEEGAHRPLLPGELAVRGGGQAALGSLREPERIHRGDAGEPGHPRVRALHASASS